MCSRKTSPSQRPVSFLINMYVVGDHCCAVCSPSFILSPTSCCTCIIHASIPCGYTSSISLLLPALLVYNHLQQRLAHTNNLRKTSSSNKFLFYTHWLRSHADIHVGVTFYTRLRLIWFWWYLTYYKGWKRNTTGLKSEVISQWKRGASLHMLHCVCTTYTRTSDHVSDLVLLGSWKWHLDTQ